MPLLLKLSWLIPLSPLIGGSLVFLLLISFNRTMNRLSKPVSYLLIISVAISTILSFLLYRNHVVGDTLALNFNVLNSELNWRIYIDDLSSMVSTFCGLAILIIMVSSFLFMERKTGYVAYFVFLGISCGAVFSFLMSGDPFHSLI